MRTIKYTSRFRRDMKRELSGRYAKSLNLLIGPVIEMLSRDQALPRQFVDHPLAGTWQSCRDCHIRPDLVLIYRLTNKETLELLRLGSHSELGL